MPGATAPRSPLRLKQLKRLGSDPDAKVVFLLGNHMKRKNFRQDGQGEEKTRRAAQRKKGGAKVRTARQKVCRLLCEAPGAVRVRTGVGTPVPRRLLAQTFARSRGVILEGLPRSELWEALYNSILTPRSG